MIKIDVDTRCWKIPKEECFLGVESDDKVRILQFELSKNEFCDGLNFTDCNCFINYKNEGNDTIPYGITDMEVQEDGTVTFTWEVSRGATIFKGNTFAVLCAKKVREDGTITNEWNSRIGSFTVSKGLEPSSSIVEVPEIDIISQLLLVAQQTNTNAQNNINQSSSLLEKAEGLGYLKEEYDVLEARMNQFTSLQEGSTTGDAELIDGRIGYDGTVHDNIGGAIRGQISELKSDLDELENTVVSVYTLSKNLFDPSKSKDGRYNWTGVIDSGTESNYLYTDYIPVTENQHLVVSRELNGVRQLLTISRIIRYREDKSVYNDDGLYTVNSVNNYLIPPDVSYVIITCSKVINLMIEVSEDGTMTDYEPYFAPIINTRFVEKEDGKGLSTNDFTDEYKEILDSGITPSTPIFHSFLPKIFVAVGRTIEIYDNQVCLESYKYHVKWSCSIGRQLKDKYVIVGSESVIGEHDITFSLMDDRLNVVHEVISSIEVVSSITSGNFIINPIGDSLTNNKSWLAEVTNISNGAITYNGTILYSVADAGNTTRTGGHEGRSGMAGNFYVGETAVGQDVANNPYWNGSQFDWNFYLSNNNFSFDGVQIFLGMNGLSLTNTANVPQIKSMVDNIRSYDNTIPIFIILCQFKGDQNGLGYQQSVDGYHSTSGKWKYEEDCKVFDLITSLYEQFKEYNNLYFVPLAECHDSANNYPTSIVAVNPRSIETVKIQTESVHPNVDGYYQFADIMYSVYCKAFDVN